MTGEAIYFLFSYLISFYFKKVFGIIIDICHYCNFTGSSLMIVSGRPQPVVIFRQV